MYTDSLIRRNMYTIYIKGQHNGGAIFYIFIAIILMLKKHINKDIPLKKFVFTIHFTAIKIDMSE